MERKRKEREVISKEEKTGDVESTTISTITPVELPKEISSKTAKLNTSYLSQLELFVRNE